MVKNGQWLVLLLHKCMDNISHDTIYKKEIMINEMGYPCRFQNISSLENLIPGSIENNTCVYVYMLHFSPTEHQ